MPDLPSPKDAAEAALLAGNAGNAEHAEHAENWATVFCYAELCTAGPEAAARLATEAFAHGMREVRAADAAGGSARRPSRLPRIPLLLTAVRTTAAAWENGGQGHELHAGLRLWLASGHRARYAGPPPRRPLVLRGLKELRAPDAELLWLADVEALTLPVVARRLGLDPATVSAELAQVRELFQDRCRRGHADAPPATRCHGYARLLEAVTRSPAADTPPDLAQHLATCPDCAEAAACLRPHGAGLPEALATGVLGWGGLSYLERRRRAAEERLGTGRPAPADDGRVEERADDDRRARLVRGGPLVTAALVSLLALTVSLMPFGGTAEDTAAPTDTVAPSDTVDRRPIAVPGPPLPPADTRPPTDAPPAADGTPADATTSAGTTTSEPDRAPRRDDPDPEPQGTATSTAPAGEPPYPAPGPAACRVRYDLVNQWPDGFQATVTVTTTDALGFWQVAWTFPDGQRIRQMWDAGQDRSGARVTATATDYNKSVPANGHLAFGFIASWSGRNSPPDDFTLNGHDCVKI